MVGVGSGIGVLLIIFVNATKERTHRSTRSTVSQSSATAVPAYHSPTAAAVTPRQQPAAVRDAVLPRLMSGQLRIPELEKVAQAV